MDHLISARRPPLEIVNKKQRTSRIVNCAVPVDHKIKLNDGETSDKYLDLAWELKKLWSKKVTMTPIVISALSRFTKWFVKRLEELEIRTSVDTI